MRALHYFGNHAAKFKSSFCVPIGWIKNFLIFASTKISLSFPAETKKNLTCKDRLTVSWRRTRKPNAHGNLWQYWDHIALEQSLSPELPLGMQRLQKKLYTWVFEANRYYLQPCKYNPSLAGGSWIIALRGLSIATPKNGLWLVEMHTSTA